MKKVIFFILLLSLNIVFAQVKSIQGKLIDSKNKLPIEGLTITIHPSNRSTSSHENGEFRFNNQHPEEDSISISGIGYETKILNSTNKCNF